MSKKATREAYGCALKELAVSNKNVVVLDADLSKSTKTADFKSVAPERFFNMGIAEGNMMGVAAGMSTCGKIPFVSTFAMFAAGRAFEQIRNSICYPNLNVKICATHAGLTVGEDGATHQSVEDLSLMRSIPNMTVINPADDIETVAAIKAVAEFDGPCYVRLGRMAVEDVNASDYKFEIGKGVLLSEGKDVSIVATGIMVEAALKAKDMLKEEGMDPYEAIVEAGRNRLRPILMTSLTTILALIPLALGFGEGAALMQPMGVVVIGGLTLGTLITLVLIPSFYCIVTKTKYPGYIKKTRKIKKENSI